MAEQNLTMEQRYLERGHRYKTAVRLVDQALADAAPMMRERGRRDRAADVVALLEHTARRLQRLDVSAEGAISGVSFRKTAEKFATIPSPKRH